MKNIFLLLIIIFAAIELPAQQRIDQLGEAVGNYAKSLTADKLQRATSITYSYGNGSVAPEYHYDYYIIVKPTSINVTITHGYDGTVVYDESADLQPTDYRKFINRLAKQKIRMSDELYPPLAGASTSYISVKANDTTIFSGDEYDLEIGNGYLRDAFYDLLPTELQQVVDNAEQYIEL